MDKNSHSIKPKLLAYVLQSLHVHPTGIQDFILYLNSGKELEFLICSGRSCHVFFPLNSKVSVPNPTVLTLKVCQGLSFLRLYLFSFVGNNSCIKVGAMLFLF